MLRWLYDRVTDIKSSPLLIDAKLLAHKSRGWLQWTYVNYLFWTCRLSSCILECPPSLEILKLKIYNSLIRNCIHLTIFWIEASSLMFMLLHMVWPEGKSGISSKTMKPNMFKLHSEVIHVLFGTLQAKVQDVLSKMATRHCQYIQMFYYKQSLVALFYFL